MLLLTTDSPLPSPPFGGKVVLPHNEAYRRGGVTCREFSLVPGRMWRN